MSMGAALQLVLLCIAAVLVLLGLAIAARRVTRNIKAARQHRQEERFRPLLMRCLAEDVPDLSPMSQVSKRDKKYVESLVWNMLTKVRGGSRESLVGWLDEEGRVERGRRKTYIVHESGTACHCG